MSINMKALTSFLGVEGLIKKGQPFEVRDNARADFLESVYFAKREGEESRSYETQTVRASSTQVVAPSIVNIQAPQQMPATQPEELKAPAAIIQAQEAEEPQQEPQPLEEKTVPQLKAQAKGLEIAGYNKMKKADLVAAIQTKQ